MIVQDSCGFYDLEIGLMEFLSSHLPTRRAIDIGAHLGEVSECLLRSGYEVYAFEPNPRVYAKLVERLGDHKRFMLSPLPLVPRKAKGHCTWRSGFRRRKSTLLCSAASLSINCQMIWPLRARRRSQ